MTLFTCKCLNIKVYIRGTENDLVQQSRLDDHIPSGLFREEYEVELDSKGITQEHNYLVHKKKIGNYTVYSCLCCSMDVYAYSNIGDNVIINRSLQCDPSKIERLLRSEEFSPAFRIVLLNNDTDFDAMPDPKSNQFESLQKKLNQVQKQLTQFVIGEEEAMENRIRQYEEAQKAAFAELQQKVKEEKKKMVSLVLQSSKYDTHDSPHKPESEQKSSSSKKSPSKKKPLSRVQSLPPSQDFSDDALFSFDGDDTNEEEFYAEMSSEDDNDDIFENERDSPPRRSPKRALKYSSSVPISVPTWGRDKNDQWHFEEEENTPSEPDQIAASMQALAQSITDDNRYIFGDRPRPRLNTGDYSNR